RSGSLPTELLHVAVDIAAAVLVSELLEEVRLDRKGTSFTEFDGVDLRPSAIALADPVEVARAKSRLAPVREKKQDIRPVVSNDVHQRIEVSGSQIRVNASDEPGRERAVCIVRDEIPGVVVGSFHGVPLLIVEDDFELLIV